jgi:hypothetical protein
VALIRRQGVMVDMKSWASHLKCRNAAFLLFSAMLLNCQKKDQFERVSMDMLIEKTLQGQIESIVMNYDEKEKRILNVHTEGGKISFPVYGRWYSTTSDLKYLCHPMKNGFICSQPLPSEYDSVFKIAGSQDFEIRKDQSNAVEFVKIVPEAMAKKVTEFDLSRYYPSKTNPSR